MSLGWDGATEPLVPTGAHLTAEGVGVPTKQGGRWHHSTLAKMVNLSGGSIRVPHMHEEPLPVSGDIVTSPHARKHEQGARLF